jgi:hypothetical protein
MKRTGLYIILLLLLGSGVTAYLMYNHQNADPVDEKPDMIVSARTLLSAFEVDPDAAAKQYVDKRIEVTGTIKSVDTSGALIIGSNDNTSEIIVAIDPRHKSGLADQKPGEIITVQGTCSSYSGNEAKEDDLLSGLGATLRFRSAGIKTH